MINSDLEENFPEKEAFVFIMFFMINLGHKSNLQSGKIRSPRNSLGVHSSKPHKAVSDKRKLTASKPRLNKSAFHLDTYSIY